jgi:signal transduction histidine kinase/DNA-binding response OmpR family regulator/ligand-binding sensor domain-containing protein
MKHQLLILSWLVSLFPSHASDVKFYSINDMYGISMREVASVCKDNNGFIWASSKTGVLRLAGDDCRIYRLSYQTTDIVSVKLVYANTVLLAYTNNGQVFCYNALQDRFDFLFYMGRILNNRHLIVFSILVDKQEDFWISSSMGLYKYHEGELIRTGNDESEVSNIAWFDDNRILFAKNEELRLMDIHTLKSKSVCENINLPAFFVSCFYYDTTENKLWIGTRSDGLFHYDFNKNTLSPIHSFPKQPVQTIKANSDSTVLIGIDGQGIWELNEKGHQVLNIYKENSDDPFSLRGNGVYDIFCDQDKRVWVCTYSGGLSFFEQATPLVNQIIHQINNSNSLSNNIVNEIVEDKSGNLWFATDNGVSCCDMQSGKWKNYYHNRQEQAQVFLSLCEDDKGRIWAGTFSSGIYVIDGKTGKELAHYSKEESSFLSSNFVFDIFRDSSGDLWIGSVTGDVICYVSKENRFKTYPSLPVYAFTELSPTQMLAACSFGLCLLDKQTGLTETLLYEYLLHDILVMDGDVWLCTNGDGLVQFNLKNKTTEKFTTESGLPSDYVNSIMQSDGYLWLGTESGLCRFDPKDKSVQTYSSSFALSNLSFNQNAHYKLRNGQLAWGTNKGAILFDPSEFQQLQMTGSIFLQDILVSGYSIRDHDAFKLTTPLDSMQEITLRYNRNNLTMEFLPLGTTVAHFKFSWIMEGVDTHQSLPSGYRKPAYTNIPAGKYVLKIKMYDPSSSHLVAERLFTVRVTPPFWGTWWFRLLLTTVIAGILSFFLRFYINRLKQRHTEDKVRFFTRMAHEIRTTITLIKAPIEELSKYTFPETEQHYLDLAAEQARRLSSTVTHLLDFQKADAGKEQLSLKMVNVTELIAHRRLMFESYARSKNVELFFTATPAAYSTAIDGSKMEKVIDNLISNAIKYSHPYNWVQISFAGDEKRWTLEVKDRGIGISRKAQKKLFREFYRSENAINSNNVGSGIGLLLAKNYVTLHDGTIYCSSRENEGSSFRITVPFKEIAVRNETLPSQTETQERTLPKPTSSKMRLLVVEDNEDLRNFMFAALHDEFEVSTANDGKTAWETILKQIPDIVVSDVMMPRMDGFELCRLIKSTYETSHIPVVLLTALAGKAEQLHGLGLGADNYLTKPFDMALVTQRIRSIIQNRKAVREKAFKLIGENNEETLFNNELNDKFIKKAIEVVQVNMVNMEFSNKEFASAMHVSEPLLYKKIKSLTDRTPLELIKAIRLNHALDLLQTRKYTVTEVSEMCGFSGLNYFGKAFKKHFGKLPSEV